ncbi:MAG: hypothetical protein JF584_08195 [Acidobacteria bacterium]|nr:hypothetical protein [Acidobacteriota bacterium]
MSLFLSFLSFELKLRLKSISTYVYFFVFGLIAFLSIAAPDSFGFVGAGKVMLNGPYACLRMMLNLSFFGVLLMAGIFGPSILRDFQQNTYQLLFTKPISKFAYLGGRWLGSMLTTIGIFFGLVVGEVLGSFAWWTDTTRVLPVNGHLLLVYLKLFIDYPVIQVLFIGSLFFLIAALTRNIVVVYLQGVALFAVYLILLVAVQSTRSLDLNRPGIFDPVGFITIRAIARYWTVVEQNTLIPTWSGVFLWNRLLYTGVGLLCVAASYLFFPMRAEGLGVKGRKKKQKDDEEELEGPPRPRFHIVLPKVQQIFGVATSVAQVVSLTRIRMKNIFKEIPFWGITVVMIINTMANSHFAGKIDDADVWPVTALMLQVVEGSSLLFLFIVATMYAGELVWRERDTHFQQIHDALPTHEWLDWGSRFFAMCSVQVVLLFVVMLCGISSQIIAGYYNFEIVQYLQELFIVTFPTVAQFCLFALLVQSLVSNKYLGHAIIIAFAIVPSFIQGGGWEDRLYLFNFTTSYTYSDMNGYGHFKAGLFWSLAYWIFWTLLLVAIAMMVGQRGTDTAWKQRLQNAKQRRGLAPYAIVFAALTAASGVWYFYNTHVLNWYHTSKMDRHLQAEYEKQYKKYQKLPQPKIVAVDTKVDIFPQTRTFDAWGTFWLKNKTDAPIGEVHLTDGQQSFYAASFDRLSSLALEDKKLGYRIYKLAQPLKPGETMRMFFHVGYASHGFRNNGEVAQLAYNGTFFDSSYMPGIGYNRGAEISNPVYRREEKLGPFEELAPRGDAYYTNVNLFTPDSDWIKYHTIVSTSGDQTAISPGYLQRKWTQGGRNYFEYSMGDTETLDFYDYNSGRYELRSEPYNDVNVEVYYDKKHPYDVDDMIAASKAGLDYYGKSFGPFQFKQYRVIEFPRYRNFAQSFPNTIPFSEGIGFIGRVEKPDDIDFTYFVTAHELGHQWWAHQLIGAQVKGSNMMSESLAEYSALRVMEKKYGTKNMRKFLRHELDGYLRGRAGEVRHEPPITLVENEPYVWYQKGSLVFYALSDYIGEDTLNSALKSLLDKWRFKGPPYPDTRDLVAALHEKTPADLQYLVTDMFEKITLYDNKVESATVTEMPDHKWKVHVVVSAKKMYADGDGKETPQPLHDLIEVGVMSGVKDKEEPIEVKKIWLTQEKTPVDFVVDKRPDRAGIDPFSKLIDRNPEDNLMDVEKK